MKLKRIAAGCYQVETPRGLATIERAEGLNEWFWLCAGAGGQDWHGSRAAAVEALKEWLEDSSMTDSLE